MRRIVLTLSTLLAAVLAPAGLAAADAPALSARVLDCQTGPDADERAADFRASMPAADDASILSLRFTLEQRRDGAWEGVPVPGARWERSKPGAAGFVFDKRVERLAAGSTYRVTVRFRWLAADGTVVRRATRSSGSCRQPDERPALPLPPA